MDILTEFFESNDYKQIFKESTEDSDIIIKIIEATISAIAKALGVESLVFDDFDSYDDGVGLVYHWFIYSSNDNYNTLLANIDDFDNLLTYTIKASVEIDEDIDEDEDEDDDSIGKPLLISWQRT